MICTVQVSKLKEQLEMTVQKLNESREVLKTNENGEDTCLIHFNRKWSNYTFVGGASESFTPRDFKALNSSSLVLFF